MKPNWKYAPEWANYLAMDGDGEWYWFENEPALLSSSVWTTSILGGRCLHAEMHVPPYQETLEKRPKEEN